MELFALRIKTFPKNYKRPLYPEVMSQVEVNSLDIPIEKSEIFVSTCTELFSPMIVFPRLKDSISKIVVSGYRIPLRKKSSPMTLLNG